MAYNSSEHEPDTLAKALEHARLNAERNGDYLQAEACRRQLAELEQLDDRRKLEALSAEQLAQRIAMDEAHLIELNQLQSFWQHRLSEFDEKAMLVEEEMIQCHADELRGQQESPEASPQRAVGNVALLELRRKEGTLVRALKYEAAAKVKAQADALEGSVLAKLHEHVEAKRRNAQDLLLRRHRTELNALRMRIRAGREEHVRERESDEGRLMLRYRNLAHDLDAQQRAEQQRLLRASKAQMPARL